jgi:hypothetical protein
VAMYFLNNFLDCDLVEDPSITTKKFFDSAQQYINQSTMPPELKAASLLHMLSSLTNNSTTINVQNFAETNLDMQYSDDFLEYMEEHGVSHTSFVKDVALISHKLSKSQFLFDSGICVIAPQDTIQSKLNYEAADGNQIKMQIIDSLKKVASN